MNKSFDNFDTSLKGLLQESLELSKCSCSAEVLCQEKPF